MNDFIFKILLGLSWFILLPVGFWIAEKIADLFNKTKRFIILLKLNLELNEAKSGIIKKKFEDDKNYFERLKFWYIQEIKKSKKNYE